MDKIIGKQTPPTQDSICNLRNGSLVPKSGLMAYPARNYDSMKHDCK